MNITDALVNLLAQKQLDIVEITNLFDVNSIISICDRGFDFKFCLAYEFVLKFSKTKNFVKMDELAQKEVIDWLEANRCEYKNQMDNFKEEFYFEN